MSDADAKGLGPAKRAFIVLGMHRSGTSSVAGVLTLLGAAAPKTLMAPGVDNPKGFFESRLVGELNDRILEAAGSSWDDWRRFDPAALSPEVLADFQGQIRTTLEHEFGSDALVVLKDPRLCRMFPIWDSVLEEDGYRPEFLLPVRTPLEVARSLNRRNGMPIAAGLLLWLRHVLDGERVTRNRRRRILLWRSFMQDWRSEVAAIQEALDWRVEITEQRAADIDSFLTADLQHEVVSDAALGADPDAHAWALEAYQALVGLAGGQDEAVCLAALDRVAARFEESCQIYAAVHTPLAARVQELEAELAQRAAHDAAPADEPLEADDRDLTREQRIERALAMNGRLIGLRNEARSALEAARQHNQAHLIRIKLAQEA